VGIDAAASFRGLPELRKCFLSLRCSDQRRHPSRALTKPKPAIKMTIPSHTDRLLVISLCAARH
jgi:hypothetical protein